MTKRARRRGRAFASPFDSY